MKSIPPLLFSSLLFALANVSFAATETTKINIQVTHDEYVKFVGTAVGAEKNFDEDEIRPVGNVNPTLSVGTFGLESNLVGSCTLSVSSLNGFSLKHSNGNQRLADYKLNFLANTIDPNNLTIILPTCNSAASSLDFTVVGKIKKNPRPGLYSDTVTLVVTTQ